MDAEQYKARACVYVALPIELKVCTAKEMAEFIDRYLTTIRKRRVFPRVEPGYLRALSDQYPPTEGEQYSAIFNDIESIILPGMTHWQSPHMHAYFPALNSYPSLLGDMLANAINSIGFSWASNPAGTELEMLVMDWLAQMIDLPEKFRFDTTTTNGGGMIATTLSEATFYSMLAARKLAIRQYRANSGDQTTPAAIINTKLVAYCSDQAHSSVEKACIVSFIELRCLQSDSTNFGLQGDTLAEAIKEDVDKGKIPFYLCATLGTTGCCAFDNLAQLGPICSEYDIWLHVDAAYAGTSFLCPEFRHFMEGIEYAQSFAFNPSKWMMVHFDCTAFWVDNAKNMHDTFVDNPVYVSTETNRFAIDYHYWHLPQSRRFRALKLFFVIRLFGHEGLQAHVRAGVERAKQFEQLVLSDDRFELAAPRHLGLVSFRLKGLNMLTERLLKQINKQGHMHCVPASIKGVYIIRFTVTSTKTTAEDIKRDWTIVTDVATDILALTKEENALKDTNTENLSLLLCNMPKIAKLMNSSYAAFLEDDDWQDTYRTVRLTRTASGKFQPNNKAGPLPPFSTELIPHSLNKKFRRPRQIIKKLERSTSLQVESADFEPRPNESPSQVSTPNFSSKELRITENDEN